MKNPFLSLVQFIDLPKHLHIHYPGPLWAVVAGYMLAIYLTLPLTPILSKAAFKLIGKRETGIIISVILAMILLAVLWLAFRYIRKELRLKVLLPFMVTIGAAANTDNPAERVHLLEYAILGFLLYRAMGQPLGRRIFWTYLLVVLAGFSDETIQWILPNRYFDLGDVGLNSIGSACGVWLGVLLRTPVPPPGTNTA
ncbi:MAG: VanZ family protein [Magnetococcales bacterium]|nr:VanZ family protein [Magnetococcales bacterium]